MLCMSLRNDKVLSIFSVNCNLYKTIPLRIGSMVAHCKQLVNFIKVVLYYPNKLEALFLKHVKGYAEAIIRPACQIYNRFTVRSHVIRILQELANLSV